VATGAGDGDAVDGGVDLAVAASIEAVAVGVAGADGDRGDLADQLAGGQGPEPGLSEQLRRDPGSQPEMRVDRVRELGAGGAARRARS
jgi:hypothetical protein